MNTPLRLAAAFLVPLLLLAGCGDDEPAESESTSEPSAEPTDDATSETAAATESATESSSPSDEPTAPATVAESATPQAGDDCTLIPTADVSSAFGTDVTLIAAGAQTCIFNTADGDFGLTVNLTEIKVDQDKYVQGTREGCEGKIRKVRAGDVAFACVGPIGPQGYVFRDSYSWVLDVVADGQAAALDLAAELLPSVIVN